MIAATGPYDEAFTEGGTPRPHYARVLDALDGHDLEALRLRVDADLAAHGVGFGDEPFTIDPVPRVLTAAEWSGIEAGLVQRVLALNAFVADVYGEKAIVRDGILAPHVVAGATYHEPALDGARIPHARPIVVAGLDIVRDEAGEFLVLEDNVRTPSGIAYAVAARASLDALLPVPDARVGIDGIYDVLGQALRDAAPAHIDEPRVVVLTDGPANVAFYEHRRIAERLGLPLVTPDELDLDEVDVVYRRTNADRCEDPVGRLLLEPCRSGAVTCANAFGSGVADDKLTHAYVEDMIRFYLGEEPLLRSVPTYDLGDPEQRERVLPRIDEIVVKPRAESGGHGVFVGPHATPGDRARMVREVLAEPQAYVAQETIALSLHPTVVDGELVPRHVDLRAFVFVTADGPRVLPGGLTRVALDDGSLVVNSSQNGGGKDTWVLG